mgnify:CR=1 FL=1
MVAITAINNTTSPIGNRPDSIQSVKTFMGPDLIWRFGDVVRTCPTISMFKHDFFRVLPGILFLVICIREEIDGDRLANICFVGNFKTGSLQFYVIVPLAIFYLCGELF